jgi:hypothetical protein
VVVILTVRFFPKNIPFWEFTERDIIILLISLLLVATFIERAVEVLIIASREKGKQDKMNILSAIKRNPKRIFKKGGVTMTIDTATADIERYKAETKTIAIRIAFILGIIISALGIRAVQPLVDPAVFKSLTNLQKALFAGMDTLVTGALLGSGSKGMHEVIEAVLNTVEKYRGYLKKGKK